MEYTNKNIERQFVNEKLVRFYQWYCQRLNPVDCMERLFVHATLYLVSGICFGYVTHVWQLGYFVIGCFMVVEYLMNKKAFLLTYYSLKKGGAA